MSSSSQKTEQQTVGAPRVAVLGAGGFIGLNVVDALLEGGITPVCLRRKTSNTIALRKRKVPMEFADLDAPDSVVGALDGSDVLVHLAGHYPRHSQDPQQSMRLGLRQMQTVLDAAAEAGVRRLVYVSSTATVAPRADGQPSTERDRYASAPTVGLYHELKWRMEEMVLSEDRLAVTVTCPGACIGPWDLRLGTAALLVAAARGVCPPLPRGLITPVHVYDVARAVTRLATMESPPERTVLVSEVVDVHDVLERFATRFGAPPLPPAISAAAGIAAADAEERRVLGTPERAGLVRELVDLIVHCAPIDASWSAEQLSLSFSPLDRALDDFVAWANRFRILPTETTHEPNTTAVR